MRRVKLNKIKNWIATKSSVIYVDGNPIAVETLPEDIRFNIDTYDRLKQDFLDIVYERDKVALAVNAKLHEIMAQIKTLTTPKPTTESTETKT